MNFDAFIHDIVDNKWNVHGVEVYDKGVLHSYGDTCNTRYPIYSATKTILSIAVGIAYDQGKIDLENSILDYIPGKNLSTMSAEQRSTFEKITLHRLMTMSVGDLPFRPEGSSYLDFSLACKIQEPETKVFNYNNISAYLVGVALTNAVGEDVCSYIDGNIFDPMQITNAEFSRCPDGYFYGASGMTLSVHDLSKIGLLLYNKGIYKGKRIVSEEYVDMATSIQQMNREGGYGYGYFITKYRDGFSINGKWGQKCYILPKRELIITYLSHIEDDSLDLLHSMEKHILGIA
ncbi:MAG: serine hydrolase [Lachnospiraceae bacterium]|nr:serine hydrolase [Lachnospiraceae bacterium]